MPGRYSGAVWVQATNGSLLTAVDRALHTTMAQWQPTKCGASTKCFGVLVFWSWSAFFFAARASSSYTAAPKRAREGEKGRGAEAEVKRFLGVLVLLGAPKPNGTSRRKTGGCVRTRVEGQSLFGNFFLFSPSFSAVVFMSSSHKTKTFCNVNVSTPLYSVSVFFEFPAQ